MELILNGYLTADYDDHPALIDNEDCDIYHQNAKSIIEAIQNIFNYQYLNKGLGARLTYIPDCSLTIYYAKDKCSLEEVQEMSIAYICGYSHSEGDMLIRDVYTGYSEYTITGLDLETFTIGGHNLEGELFSHIGEYCWIKLVTNLD